MLAATVALDLPRDPWPAVDPTRPVEAHWRVAAHWRRTEWGWRTTLRLDRLVQGRRVDPARRDLLLELPGSVAPAPAGAAIVARGYLRRSAGYANRLPVEPGPWRLAVKSHRLVARVASPGPVARLATFLRRRVEAACERAEAHRPDRDPPAAGGGADRADGSALRPHDGPSGGGVAPAGTARVRALVLGEPSGLPPAWVGGLRRSGLSHLLAVSGLHVGLIGGVALTAATPLGRRGRIVVALAAVGVYLLVAGPRPALLRSTLMAGLAGAAMLSGRTPAAGNALALAAAGLVLVRPELAADLGFGLTVAATGGIVLVAPVFVRTWSGAEDGVGEAAVGGVAGRADDRASPRQIPVARRWLVRALAASVAAQLAAVPLAVPAFHLVTPAAPLLNLAAVPWTAAVLVAACGWSLLASVLPAAGAAVAPLLDVLAAPYGWPAAGPPWAWGCLPVAASPVVCALAAGAGAVVLARPRRPGAWGLAVGMAAVACGGRVIAGVAGEGLPGGGGAAGPAVALVTFDVGQGDSLLLLDGRRRVLVDGGGWRRGDFGGRVLLPALLGEGVARLDVAVLSHPDADHCGGLVDLASYVAIDEVWATDEALSAPCGRRLSALPAVTVRRLAAGDRRRVGRWRFEVLHPPTGGHREGGGDDDNDRSLVLAAAAEGRRALLTGDVEERGERGIAGRLRRLAGPAGDGLPFDVLKVAHHGSRTSTTAPLLAAVRPRLALISAGPGNPYGHPAAPVLDRLRKAGVRVLRTDLQGEIVLRWTAEGPLAIELPGAPR